MTALDTQIGGDHYKKFPIQPVEFITVNRLGFLEGCIIKRLCRRAHNDLQKIKHEVDLLIEIEGKQKFVENSKVFKRSFLNEDYLLPKKETLQKVQEVSSQEEQSTERGSWFGSLG